MLLASACSFPSNIGIIAGVLVTADACNVGGMDTDGGWPFTGIYAPMAPLASFAAKFSYNNTLYNSLYIPERPSEPNNNFPIYVYFIQGPGINILSWASFSPFGNAYAR